MRLATVLATDLTFIRPLSSCAPGPKELLATQHTHATQTGMCSAVCLHQSKQALRKVEDELQWGVRALFLGMSFESCKDIRGTHKLTSFQLSKARNFERSVKSCLRLGVKRVKHDFAPTHATR